MAVGCRAGREAAAGVAAAGVARATRCRAVWVVAAHVSVCGGPCFPWEVGPVPRWARPGPRAARSGVAYRQLAFASIPVSRRMSALNVFGVQQHVSAKRVVRSV